MFLSKQNNSSEKSAQHHSAQVNDAGNAKSLPAVPVLQQKTAEEEPSLNTKPVQKKENKTGMPDNLKSGIENLSGMDMGDVKVYYNSSQPAQLNAHAYAQGSQIHIGPGQEQHLAHEAWHVVQQRQGRVKPTMQMKQGVAVNDDPGLENEADVMGAKALQMKPNNDSALITTSAQSLQSIQMKTLAHSGRDGALGETPDIPIIGGNVGPATGKAYVEDLGAKATKPAALAASGAGYAGFTADKPVAGLLSIDSVFRSIDSVKQAITDYINGLKASAPATTTAAAELHIKTTILKPKIVAEIKNDISDQEVGEIYDSLRDPVTKNPSNKFFAKVRPDGLMKTYAKTKINADWRSNENVLPIDPFLYGARTTYSGTELRVFYQHSPDWPGYVSYIDDGASAARMRLEGAISNPNTAGIHDEFGRKHHETNNENLVGDLTLDAGDERVRNEKRWDSMTKLAGEGARFICVRDNISIMADKSRFYVIGATTKYVTLEDLWSSWATVFTKENNIPNAKVRAEILTSNKWTYNMIAGQAARVHNAGDPAFGASDVNLT